MIHGLNRHRLLTSPFINDSRPDSYLLEPLLATGPVINYNQVKQL